MVAQMNLYLEGGQQLRVPMTKLIKGAAGVQVNIKIHPCGPGGEAIKKCAQDPSSLLLIDSEGNTQPWMDGIASRIGGGDRAFFMVPMMEAWFLADRPALAAYYGPDFNPGSLPANPNPENILKTDVATKLREATRHCAKGRYHKVNHSHDLLLRIDPQKVYSACPHFKRLIDFLRLSLGAYRLAEQNASRHRC